MCKFYLEQSTEGMNKGLVRSDGHGGESGLGLWGQLWQQRHWGTRASGREEDQGPERGRRWWWHCQRKADGCWRCVCWLHPSEGCLWTPFLSTSLTVFLEEGGGLGQMACISVKWLPWSESRLPHLKMGIIISLPASRRCVLVKRGSESMRRP